MGESCVSTCDSETKRALANALSHMAHKPREREAAWARVSSGSRAVPTKVKLASLSSLRRFTLSPSCAGYAGYALLFRVFLGNTERRVGTEGTASG
jgi:hypothetical protein